MKFCKPVSHLCCAPSNIQHDTPSHTTKSNGKLLQCSTLLRPHKRVKRSDIILFDANKTIPDHKL